MSIDIEQWLGFDYTYKLDGAGGSLGWLADAGKSQNGTYEYGEDDEIIFKADGDGPTTTPFIASTLEVDRMGDVLEQTSWRLKNYRRNPVILHEHRRGMVVGRGVAGIRNSEAHGKRLEIGVVWDTSDINPVGQLMGHQHANNFRHAGSVGFRPGKAVSRKDLPDDSPFKVTNEKISRWYAGYYYKANELLEFSPVSVPANPSAQQLRNYAQEAEDREEQVRRFVEESTQKSTALNLLAACKEDPEILRQFLGLIWGSKPPENTTKNDDIGDFLGFENG